MTIILRILSDENKAQALLATSTDFRDARTQERIFEIEPDRFRCIPTSPFAYWVSEKIVMAFASRQRLEDGGRRVERGLFTGDDSRFLRCYWEIRNEWIGSGKWSLLSKGGAYSPFYFDVYLCVKSDAGFSEIHESIIRKYEYLNGNSDWVLHPECHYLRPGLTYPLRTTSDFSARVLPAGCYWTNKGISIFESEGHEIDAVSLFFMLGIVNSRLFREFLSLRMGAAQAAAKSYEEGIVASMPWPSNELAGKRERLALLARTMWKFGRRRDFASETSHAFLLPAALRSRLGGSMPDANEAELASIRAEIDAIAFDLYGFTEADRLAAMGQDSTVSEVEVNEASDDADDGDEDESVTDTADGLLSWAIGVAFGRFDWRLATGERAAPSEPDPFDPLPFESPGMLPDGSTPFHAHAGILVDDPGHPHDLPHLVEDVLTRVSAPVPSEVRRWLQKDFFPFHLQRYSKSRRKAPIYWPLSTASGSYTLWLYYPSLSSQTIYTAINDFLEPKLKQVGEQVSVLRAKSAARSREDEKQFESLQLLELELIELRDTLLNVAPSYKPNLEDGVQITAAPLWSLFRHKPWQKVLKETWAKLEKGDYDWAHLAMNYWPERVREKCKVDNALAIAHGLNDLYVEPVVAPKRVHGKKKGGDE